VQYQRVEKPIKHEEEQREIQIEDDRALHMMDGHAPRLEQRAHNYPTQRPQAEQASARVQQLGKQRRMVAMHRRQFCG
jgi:hypothetical protein